MFKNKKKIYLDYAGSTPINKNVAKKYSYYQSKYFSNPSAIYKSGLEARLIINEAKDKIASLISAHQDEIIFTGSGTESDALAIFGVVNEWKKNNRNILPHIITTNIEHSAVLENVKLLEERGEIEVTYIKVSDTGIVDPKEIKKALKENTILVSVMYANNEIGTIQPIREIAKEIRHYKKMKFSNEHSLEMPWERDTASTRNFSVKKYSCISKECSFRNKYPQFHTDASQAMNYLFVENIEKLGVDMMTFNGSKIYGPKGVGVLYKKRGINLSPLYFGGGQEDGLRSGTENVASIMGIAIALEEVIKIKEKENERLVKLRDYTIEKLLSLGEEIGYKIVLNGDKVERLPNNINISILGISSELVVIELDAKGIEISEKSACHSGSGNNSHVIEAIRKKCNRKKEEFFGSLRISIGQETTKKDLDYLVSSLAHILNKYKKWK